MFSHPGALRAVILLPALLLIALPCLGQNFTDVLPSPQQVAWQDLEMGGLVCFGLNTFTDKEWGDGTVDPGVFDPLNLDTDQWAQTAKAAGLTYLVLVAKHHDGFCLWPTKHTDYSVKRSPWRNGQGDLVRELADSCRKHGLGFGVYLSPWDRHEPSYEDSKAYDDFYVKQMGELCRGYGEIVEFWLDGAGSEGHKYDFDRYHKTLRTYQPNAMVFSDVGLLPYGDIRWVGNESGNAPVDNWCVIEVLGKRRWQPAEVDTPLRTRHWYWHPKAEQRLQPLDKLIEIYHNSVGRGAQLMLGLAPDDRGLMPEVDVERLTEFGAKLGRIYGKNLAQLADVGKEANAATDGDPDTIWEAPHNAHTATIELKFPREITVDRTVSMEWLNAGQHVQKYRIEAWRNGRWETLHTGASIGHKRIDIFPRTSCRGIRLNILMATRQPIIREFQVYDGAAKP